MPAAVPRIAGIETNEDERVRKLELDRQVMLGFGLAVLVLIVVALVSYLTIERFVSTSRKAVREAEIVVPLQRVLALAYEAETAQRGYLFTGEQAYRTQRDKAMQDTRDALAELRALSADDAALIARVDALPPIVEARFAVLDELLRIRERSPDEARELLAAGAGRPEMSRLGREVNLLAAERNARLRADSESARLGGERVLLVFFVAVALVVAALLLIQRLIRREIAARQQAFHELAASQARQAQLVRDLQSANEELTSFAYVASHDLKAPLRAIGSLAQWISSDYADKFDDEGREQMALLLGRVKRMDRLIDGILQYSRVGRVKETRSLVDLDDLVAETVDLLAPPPHVTVTVGPLPSIVIERTRAQQLFQNLIGNAIQYLDKPQGTIRVDCHAEGDSWHFRVEDNGPGIDPRHWDRVFQMFQSLAPRDRTESTGIGLTLAKKIVEMHGGRIWVESKVHLGSTFHFTLPKAAVNAS